MVKKTSKLLTLIGAASLAGISNTANADSLMLQYKLNFGGSNQDHSFYLTSNKTNSEVLGNRIEFKQEQGYNFSLPLFTTNQNQFGILNSSETGKGLASLTTTQKLLIGAVVLGGAYAIANSGNDSSSSSESSESTDEEDSTSDGDGGNDEGNI